MAKHASKSTAPVAAEKSGPLSESVDQLIGEVRLLRQVLDEIREDLSWVTRNGLQIQPIEHVQIKQMARDVTAEDWSVRLVVERFSASRHDNSWNAEASGSGETGDELQATVEGALQGHLEVVLTVLDGVRTELLAAIRKSNPQSKSRTARDAGSLFQDAATVNVAADDEADDEADAQSIAATDPTHKDCTLFDHNAAEYKRWCREVRDVARLSSEGVRTIEANNKKASMSYEVARLATGEWALTWRCGYQCGDLSGVSSPWTEFSTRGECVQCVLRAARKFFASPVREATQSEAQAQMQRLLSTGLFDFIEPEPHAPADRQPASASDITPLA